MSKFNRIMAFFGAFLVGTCFVRLIENIRDGDLPTYLLFVALIAMNLVTVILNNIN